MKNKDHHKHKINKKPWIIVGIIFAVILLLLIGSYAIIRHTLNQMNTVEINEENLDAVDEDKVINIALYGIDGDSTNEGRSDAILIFSIDQNKQMCRLCSIMRDSYVEIEGYGMDKINHAYSYGGPELAMKTLNQNFGLNITHFAAVDFNTLPIIVDMLGGVEIEITTEEAMTGSIPGISEAGVYTLDGTQALGYCRIRYASGNDFQRTQRQRNVLNGIIKSILAHSVTEWPNIASVILPYVTTNYSGEEILSLIVNYGTYAQHGIKETRFPVDGTHEGVMIDGVYYLTFDIPAQAELIRNFVFKGILP